MMKLPQRLPNVLMLVLWVGIGWTVMTITHELGHVAGGWLSGAHLTQLELSPWGLPFSIYHPDPYPLATLWAGPGLGCAIPLVGWLLMPHRCVAFVAASCWAWSPMAENSIPPKSSPPAVLCGWSYCLPPPLRWQATFGYEVVRSPNFHRF